ncbi:hypothetical protein DY000_02057910 [Brassica cretica]|uniref:DUF7900 domain-containing protein n=1 Tax=Brassica cretica TaxID=69181 RepID=A0ABQ7ADK0_BRACR|nr:hypothetical protein DY000_02057910 [Brassica cretica]
MVTKGCDPDIVTLNILINGYCKAKLVDDGMTLFRKMSSPRGVVADTVTYNILVQGFCQSGQLNVAKELFQEMVSEGAHPDIVTYGILLDGLCDKWRRVKPNVKTYTIMIGGLCKKGSLPEAGLLFKKMEEDGIAPDSGPYNTLIRAHLRDGDLANEEVNGYENCNFFRWFDVEKPHGWQHLALLAARDIIREQKEELAVLRNKVTIPNHEGSNMDISNEFVKKFKEKVEECEALKKEVLILGERSDVFHNVLVASSVGFAIILGGMIVMPKY